MPKKIAGLTVYTLQEVADALGVTTRSVSEYIKSGRLRAQKYGRSWHITEKNLQAFLDADTEENADGG